MKYVPYCEQFDHAGMRRGADNRILSVCIRSGDMLEIQKHMDGDDHTLTGIYF